MERIKLVKYEDYYLFRIYIINNMFYLIKHIFDFSKLTKLQIIYKN